MGYRDGYAVYCDGNIVGKSVSLDTSQLLQVMRMAPGAGLWEINPHYSKRWDGLMMFIATDQHGSQHTFSVDPS